MSKKIYLHLLFYCGILCQEIFAKLSDEDTRISSDSLVRKRRVISHLPCGLTQTPIEHANYMVIITQDNRAHCAGVILSHYTVLTAAQCVLDKETHYRVLSGSANLHNSKIHNVTSKAVYHGNPPHQKYDGIGLITIDPPFVFGQQTGNIHLHVGPLPVRTRVTVFGWGYNYPTQPGPTAARRELRSITLPIITDRECQNAYESYYVITEKNFCTYDPRQYCALTDAGAPLVFNNKLAGIHVWKGERTNRINPDVFIDLQRPEYRQWIRQQTLLM